MARSSSRETSATRRLAIRLLLWALVVCFVLVAMLWTKQQFEKFLISDARFVLTAPTEYGQESPNLRIEGVTFANRTQILRVFENDLGRSVFLLPRSEEHTSELQSH